MLHERGLLATGVGVGVAVAVTEGLAVGVALAGGVEVGAGVGVAPKTGCIAVNTRAVAASALAMRTLRPVI